MFGVIMRAIEIACESGGSYLTSRQFLLVHNRLSEPRNDSVADSLANG